MSAPAGAQPLAILDENFDDNAANGWTLSGLWHISQSCATAASVPKYLGYNQDSTCTYNTVATTSGSAQVSINLAGTSFATLSFKHRFTVESYSSPYDTMKVEVSANGGSTWTLLDQWDSTDAALTTFTTASYSLNSYTGGTRLLRFSFDSIDSGANSYLGWLIDDVLVSATGTATLPSSPQSLAASAVTTSAGMIQLTWSAPSSNGGSAVTNYHIYRGTSSGGETYLTQVGNVLTYQDSGLANGKAYYYRVAAVNAAGEGVLSNEASATTINVPSVPTSLTAQNIVTTPGRNKLLWNAPSSNGGAAITNYRIYRGTASGSETLLTTAGNVLTYNDDTCPVPNPCYYQVAAKNVVGDGGRSNQATAGVAPISNYPPSIPTISGPAVRRTGESGSYSFSASDQEGGAISLTIDWGDGSSTTATSPATQVHTWWSLGSPCLRAYATDSSGVRSPWSNCYTVAIEANRAPMAPAAPSGTTSVHASVSATYTTVTTDPDGDSLTYTFDWGDGTTSTTGVRSSGQSGSTGHAWASPGSYCVKSYATDTYGSAQGPVSTCTTVAVTNSAPGTPSPSGPSSTTTGWTEFFNVQSYDPDGDSISYTFDWGDTTSDTVGTYSSGSSISVGHSWSSAGTYCVRALAQDAWAASPYSGCDYITVNAPNPAPGQASTPSGPSSGVRGTSLTYSTSASDPGDNVYYVFDWGDGTAQTGTGWVTGGSSASDSHTWNTAGSYCVSAYATDSAENSGSWSPCKWVSISNPANPAPGQASTPSGPSSGVRGTSLTYSTSASDPGDSVYYTFDWNDGTAQTTTGWTSGGFALSASHTWNSAGSYCVLAYARDSAGNSGAWSPCKWVNISNPVNQPPTACMATPTVSAMTVSVDGTCSSDPEFGSLTYTWNWGDGTATTSGAQAQHTYTHRATGDLGMRNDQQGYLITLTVQDTSSNSDTETRHRTVGPTDAELARYWAPIFYQDTALAADSSTIVYDEITRFDFDGVGTNFVGNDNWDHAATGNHDAYVYYHVTESLTDYYLGYAVFHPRDFDSVFCCVESEHENDMETVLLQINKDSTGWGKFEAALTMAHNYLNAYKATAGPSHPVTITANAEADTGTVVLEP